MARAKLICRVPVIRGPAASLPDNRAKVPDHARRWLYGFRVAGLAGAKARTVRVQILSFNAMRFLGSELKLMKH
jgi:hypothetical protein